MTTTMNVVERLVGSIDAPRPTLFTFELPHFGTYALLGGPTPFWIQIFMVLVLQSGVSAIFATIIYYGVVRRRGDPSTYLIVFGVVIPAVMAFPPFIAPILGIANIAALIGVSALCIIIPFHALEALYGTSPPATEKSLSTYLLYCCTVVALRLDRKTGEPIPLTPIKLRKQVQSTLIKVLLQTLFTSFLQVYDWAPFPSPRNDQSFIPLSTMFHWGHILNNMLIAGYTSMALDFGAATVGVVVAMITGKVTIELMESPMTKSQSVSDFWGNRWNLMVHHLLKRGVYIPIRKNNYPQWVAAGMAFVISGLLHEYVLGIVALKAIHFPESGGGYSPRWGNHFIFFLWNGALILVEYLCRDHPLIRWCSKNLPKPIITLLVVMTVVPMGHVFTDEYVRSGFYDDFAAGCPTFVKVSGN